MMNGPEKSDPGIVAMKPANKAGQPACGANCGEPNAAESVAKGGDQGECGPAKRAPDTAPMWGLRVSMPKRSMWRVAQFDTLRLRLIKVAARVVEMKTMIRIHLPTSCPTQDILRLVLAHIPRLVT